MLLDLAGSVLRFVSGFELRIADFCPMTWLQRYRVRHYLRNSIWVWPIVAMAAAMVAVPRFVHWFEEGVGWEAKPEHPGQRRERYSVRPGQRDVHLHRLPLFVAPCWSCKLASAGKHHAIIGTMFRDPVIKLSLSVFVFSVRASIWRPWCRHDNRAAPGHTYRCLQLRRQYRCISLPDRSRRQDAAAKRRRLTLVAAQALRSSTASTRDGISNSARRSTAKPAIILDQTPSKVVP